MKRAWSWSVLSAVVLAAAFASAAEDAATALSLGPPFTDHMVLQRDRPVPVWGWAAPQAKVTVAFAGQRKTATAGTDGAWSLTLDPLAGSFEARELTVQADRGAVTITDVLVGDVWVCAGQSNMEMGLNLLNMPNKKLSPERPQTAPEHLARAHQPGLRLFTAPKQFVTEPAARYLKNDRPNALGRWHHCTIDNATNAGIWWGFSAVAFYFGLEIQPRAGVPVGLVVVAHGGTAAEAWMSPAAVKALTHKPHCPAPADATNESDTASTCYNGLLHPLLPMAVRGVIWYQGENNANGDLQYAETLEKLIADWRDGFSRPDLPFYIVQLCSWSAGEKGTWPEVREAQLHVHRRVKHTGLVVTTDLYDWTIPWEIHPTRKPEIGRRLGLWALRDLYGVKDIEPSGPIYREMKIEGEKIRLLFDHAAGGVIQPAGYPSNQLKHFEIAGEDRQFHEASALVDGETVLVSSKDVPVPRHVRYGWSPFVPFSFYNMAGLPASPFRTGDAAPQAPGQSKP